MIENQSIRYWFALIISSIISIICAFAIIALCKSYTSMFIEMSIVKFLAWYLLWKFVLSRFGVIRALFQINNNDQQPPVRQNHQQQQQPRRRQQIRRE
jgi:hypothetical protein